MNVPSHRNVRLKTERSAVARDCCRVWIGLAAGLLLLYPGSPSASEKEDGWLSGWSFRRQVVVENTGPDLFDHPIRVVFDNADSARPDFGFSQTRPAGDDLRATAADGLDPLDQWVEEWSDSLQRGSLWMEMPFLPAGGQTTAYLYYGHPTAGSVDRPDSVFLFWDGFEAFDTRLNAPDSLGTPTYDGSGQAVHPDVVYFPEGWGSPTAYHYYMMMTPYPDGNENYENPSLLVSDDGLLWQVPPGVTNPIWPGGVGGYNSDPDMLYAEGQLRAYFCWAAAAGGDDTSRVLTFSSADGINWSDTTEVLTAPNYLVSPTVLFADSTYIMWYVKTASCWSDTSTVHRRLSSDGLDWPAEEAVSLSLDGWVVWHVDVQAADSGYIMLVAAYPEEFSCVSTALFRAYSSDGLSWTVDPEPLLQASPSGWDEDLIYRSSFIVEEDLYRIWYSARRTDGGTGEEFWHIGYTQGTLEEFGAQGAIKWDRVVGDASGSDTLTHGDSLSLMLGAEGYSEIYTYLSGSIGFSGWFYDDLDTTADGTGWLTLYDSQHIIGVGVFVDVADSVYSYASYVAGPWQGTPTGVDRTAGWHRLAINVLPDSCQLWIDEQLVGHLDALDSGDIERIELEGHGWFDDVSVRDFIWPEPQVSVGQEEWPFPIEGLQVRRHGSTAVELHWEPLPGAAEYRIYRSLNDPLAMPESALAVTSDTLWIDDTILTGDPDFNYYYQIRGWSGSVLSVPSGAVGVFHCDQINH